MATGGIFTLITNDGKQDRMLMATALLHDRLQRIWQQKKAANPSVADDDVAVLPSLIDIEKTHILFTNAHFKPFAAIGFEYNKTQPTSGTVSLGERIQFSIPQFGDFFHDMAFHCILSQPTLTVTGGTADSDSPAMRWCPFPGERLLKDVQQEVNGNPLDEYTFLETSAHRVYRVAPNKMTAWERAVGQEQPEEGYVTQPNWALSGVTADSHRIAAQVFRGAQTPSAQKTGTLELFIPLLFWYNKDVRLAVPSVAIPYGQRFINVQLATAAELVGLVPRGSGTWASPNGSLSAPTLTSVEIYINNIFVNPEVHKIYIKRVGFSLIRVHRQQLTAMSASVTDIRLQQLKWPIEYLMVGVKVRDYYAASTAEKQNQYLDAWDSYGVFTDQTYKTTGQNVEYSSLLCAVSGSTTLGIAADTGALTGTATLAQSVVAGDVLSIGGALFTVTTTPAVAAGAAVTGVTVSPAPGTAALAATVALQISSRKVVKQGLQYSTKRWAPIVDSIRIRAHGIDIVRDTPAGFFNAYTPYHYGGANINAPKDVGMLFVPFCLYPGTYQPSGHINISRAREFSIDLDSAYLDAASPVVPCNMVVLASAINFLLISDGSAVLRYST